MTILSIAPNPPLYEGAALLAAAETPGRLLLLLFLILLNAFFVAAEFALVKVHRSELEEAAARKRIGASFALRVVENGGPLLSACQLGIIVSTLLLGAVGEPYLSAHLIPLLEPLGLGEGALRGTSFVLAVALIAFVHLVLGERIPRVFGIRRAVGTVIVCSPLLRAFHFAMAGPVWLATRLSDALTRQVFRMEPVVNANATHTADDLRKMLEEPGKTLEVTKTEHEILVNALELSDLQVKDILTPRNEVVVLDVNRTFSDNLDTALESKHTRFPLVDRHLDKTLGLIHIKDLLGEMRKDSPNLFALKRDLMAVSEMLPLDEMLQLFLSSRAHMALVVDEFGGSVGLVMLDDVLDQVVGEIFDEFDDEEEVGFERIDESSFLVEGWLPLHELADFVQDLDLEDPDVTTVGGYLTNRLGRIPEIGETLEVEGYRAEVLKSDDRTVQEIRFTALADPGGDENSASAGDPGAAEQSPPS